MSLTAHSPLAAWLAHLESLHGQVIDMGLTRVARVRDAMGLYPKCPVVIVGGTNGKGSVCAMLTAMLRAGGYKVGTYTSPHILHYNERVAINGEPVSDARITASFAAIEAARGDTSLSYFEFGTLGAMHAFVEEGVDVAVMEVGLGGRLDAVNVFDADVAAVVSVDIDHQDYLGDNREDIGFEKAGIFRAGKPAICADPQPPQRLIEHARAIGAQLQLAGVDYQFERLEDPNQQWRFAMGEHALHALPLPALRGGYQIGNAACVLAIVEALRERLPLAIAAIKRGLLEVEWPGRFQVLPGRPLTIFDVGHNPHAVRAMVADLARLPYAATRHAVFSMLADKDIDSVIALAKDSFDCWHVAGLNLPRGMSAAALGEKLAAHGVNNVTLYPDLDAAWRAALSASGDNDRIMVFGSFHTVAEVMAARQPAR